MSDNETTGTNDTQATDTPPQVPDTTQGEASSPATFTQSELDKIVGERAKRAKEAGKSELLQELGVDDFGSLKSLLEDYNKRKQAEMSEAEKALQQADAERKKREQLEQQIADMKASQLARQRESALKSALRKAGASNEDDLFILVNAKMQDDFLAVFDAEANADAKQMEAFIKQVQSSYDTYFATAGAGSPSKSGGQVPTTVNTEEAQRVVDNKFAKL